MQRGSIGSCLPRADRAVRKTLKNHVDSGYRDILRRDRRGAVRRRARPARWMHAARRSARACTALSGDAARRIRRRGARTRIARPHSPPAAAGARGDGPRRRALRGPRRGRLHRRAGARRRAAGRRQRRGQPGLRARSAGDRRASSGGAPALAAARGEPARLSIHRAAGLRRAHAAHARDRRGPIRAARRNPGRCRGRGVRQDRQAARSALSRRIGARATRHRRPPRPVQVSAPDDRLRRSRFQLQRLEDCGRNRMSQAHARRTDPSRHRARLRGSGGRCSGREMRDRDGNDRTRTAGRCRRRRRKYQAARIARPGRGQGRLRRSLPAAGILHRQRRDDCLGRRSATAK